LLFAFSPPCLYFSFVHCLSAVWLAPSFIRLYVRTLPKFQNLPKLKSTNKPLFIFILALTYPHFSFVISLSAVWLAPSFIRLYVRTLPKFQNLPKLKSTNNPLFIFILALTYPHFSFVISLSARAARTVICSSFVRHFFVLCSSFVRHFFVLCSSFVRHLFVICSSFVRHLFVICFGYYTPSPWERVGERIFCSSFHYLPVRLAPSFVRSLFVFPISSLYLHYFILPSPFAN